MTYDAHAYAPMVRMPEFQPSTGTAGTTVSCSTNTPQPLCRGVVDTDLGIPVLGSWHGAMNKLDMVLALPRLPVPLSDEKV